MAKKRAQRADGSVEIATSDAVDRSRLTVAQQQRVPQPERPQRGPQSRRVGSDLGQVMPLVERALGVLNRREVQPQVGLLKSTMLQLDSTFTDKAYGASSFTNFIAKLQNADLVEV